MPTASENLASRGFQRRLINKSSNFTGFFLGLLSSAWRILSALEVCAAVAGGGGSSWECGVPGGLGGRQGAGQVFPEFFSGELWPGMLNFAGQVEGKPWGAPSVTTPHGFFFSVVFPFVLNCFGNDINETRKGLSGITEIGMSRWEITVISLVHSNFTSCATSMCGQRR